MGNTTAESGAPAKVSDGVETGSDSEQIEPKISATETKTVSWDNHRRALDDMHKHKKRSAELEQELGNITSDRLKEKEDFKGLAEREKARADEAENKYQNVAKSIVNTHRLSEVKTIALQAGLRKEAVSDLELLDLQEEIRVEATSENRFLVHGAQEFVDRLKNSKPHWFESKTAPKINSGGGGVPPAEQKQVTPDDVNEAEREFKRGRLTRANYQAVFDKYREQRAKPT